VDARLVHGDLSEYNILVAPSFQVEHAVSSAEDSDNDLQAVLIDFGQAVEVRHPEAIDLLRRDLERVRSFFVKQGVTTLTLEDSLNFVTDETQNDEEVEMKAEATSNTVEALS
jgi:RIO kinase 1